jgi:hypothetical protein
MTLDYIHNMNAYGENIVRLYDFDKTEAKKFRDVILKIIIKEKKNFDLGITDFIRKRNCNLVLRISEEDTGMVTSDKKNFFCDLSIKGYEQMVSLLEPFCTKDTKGYQWLYDIDNETDFLFSPCGTW